LAILGQGELNDYLQKLIDDYSLTDSVRILGFKKNPYAYLNKAKIFAFSSFFEGCPNAILEAYAVGLPVVTTDGVGIREIVAPETHYAKKTDCLEHCSYGVLTPVCDGKKYDANEPLTQGEIELQKGISLLLSNQDCIEHYKLMSKERIRSFTKESILGKWIRQ
jgi:glycosyltransferase involved in cell wall biosynthesis